MMKSPKIGLLFAVFAIVCPQIVLADLYTDYAMSLDWIVDSADGFYLIRVDEVDHHGLPTKSTVVGRMNKSMSSRRINRTLPARSMWQHRLSGGKLGDEWLLAVRGDEETTRPFYAINLSQPISSYRRAALALDEDGKVTVLKRKEEILKAVEARIVANVELSPHCDQELVDQCAMDHNYVPDAAFLGGYPFPVNCDFWDPEVDDPDYDLRSHDTILTALIVPASRPRPTAMIEKAKGLKRTRHVESRERLQAGLHPRLSDAAKPLVGNWRITYKGLVLHLTFHPQSTMLADITSPTDKTRKPLSFFEPQLGPGIGGGYWELVGDRLRINTSSILYRDRWTGPGHATLFQGEIESIEADRITFKSGEVMTRTEMPVKTFHHPQKLMWLKKNE